jgi:hypothetical protein
MLVGHTDLLIVGHVRDEGDHSKLADEVLEVRAKKKPNASTGALKDRLAKVPAKAVGFVVGEFPEDMKRELSREFNPMPSNITAFAERGNQGLDFNFETNLPNAEDAGKFLQKIGDLRKEGIKSLQDEMQRPRRQGEPEIPFQTLINLLGTIQVQSKGDTVQVGVFVADGLVEQLLNTWAGLIAPRDFAPPPGFKCN